MLTIIARYNCFSAVVKTDQFQSLQTLILWSSVL